MSAKVRQAPSSSSVPFAICWTNLLFRWSLTNCWIYFNLFFYLLHSLDVRVHTHLPGNEDGSQSSQVLLLAPSPAVLECNLKWAVGNLLVCRAQNLMNLSEIIHTHCLLLLMLFLLVLVLLKLFLLLETTLPLRLLTVFPLRFFFSASRVRRFPCFLMSHLSSVHRLVRAPILAELGAN
jgi:hypothetical protein